MKIHAFILAWNEIEIIHLTIKHYQKFCDSITLFDNHSDDGTPEVARDMGCRVKTFGQPGVLDDKEYLKVKNYCYSGVTEDWVVVCDADEVLYHPDIKSLLTSCNVLTTYGWDVFSNDMPKDDFLEIQTGQYSPNYCKSVCFRKDVFINFQYGCHIAKPLRPQYSKQHAILFHYRNIGGYKRLSERHAIYRKRMSAQNIKKGLGCHYLFPEEQRKREWYAKFNAKTPIDFDGVLQLAHCPPK